MHVSVCHEQQQVVIQERLEEESDCLQVHNTATTMTEIAHKTELIDRNQAILVEW